MTKDDDGNKNLPTTPPASNPPSIPDQNIDQVIALSDDTAMWCKLTEGGFMVISQGKIIPKIVGRLVSVQPYLINFDAGDRLPAKRPHVQDDTQIPEGYSRRCDIKMDVGTNLIGLSLPLSSIKFYLSPYLRHLKNRGLRPEQVITRITSKRATNNQGVFNVAVFELVEDAEKTTPSEAPSSTDASPLPEGWE